MLLLQVHGNFHGSFWSIIFLIRRIVRTWTYPWIIAKKNYITVTVTTRFPWTFLVIIFLIKLDVAGYMEISMDPFSNKFLN